MGLKILTGRDGEPRATWYGRICVKGTLRTTNLNINIEGMIPRDAAGNIALTKRGDAAFERSRKAAQKAFEIWRKETKTDPAALQEKAHKARTGVSAEGIALSRLATEWTKRKRTYNPTETSISRATCCFDNFRAFANEYMTKHPGVRCETINDITPEIAKEWFDRIKAQFAWESVKGMMGLMRGAYHRHSTCNRANPFDDIVLRNRESENARVNHKPLDAAETQRLFDCSRNDPFIYPLIVTAACTGMRLGDCCNLTWADVDLRGGFIECQTAKAGVRVVLPIFDRLRAVLDERAAIPADGKAAAMFVFPEAHELYTRDASRLCKLVKPYFARAVFGGDEAEDVEPIDAEQVPFDEAIAKANFTEAKSRRITEVYNRYKAGERCANIGKAMNISKQQVSDDLRIAENITGEKLRPGAMISSKANEIEKTRKQRAVGCRAASLYGWHSLRATFVVLAIEAGVPLADVQKVVGHSTTEMTIQYFNPEKKHAAERVREQMRGGVLDGRKNGSKRIGTQAITTPAPVTPTIDQLIAGMSKRQKQAFIQKLIASM